MTTAAQVIAVGERYVGVKESPTGSNKQQFGVWYGMNGVPWCAIFASYCLYVAGYRWSDATTAKGFSYCPDIVAWGKRHGRISRTPHVGDLAVAVDGARPHHVELVRRVLLGNQFEGLGGNTGPENLSNGGEVMIHSHGDGSWVFVTPYYSAPSPAPSPTPSAPVTKHHITRNIGLTTPYTTGSDVKWAQGRLTAMEIPVGPINGIFGPRMHNAIILFQRRVGLVADGVLGPVTGDHLQSGK